MARGCFCFGHRALLLPLPLPLPLLHRFSSAASLLGIPIISVHTRRNYDRATMSNKHPETSTVFDELKGLDKGFLFDFGHPLLNRVAESFVKAAGIGAVQAVTREACAVAVENNRADSGLKDIAASSKKHGRFPDLRAENCKKSLETMVKNTGKESFQWGLAAGMYSGLTYGLREARGSHDWKNRAVAGAVTGAALVLTAEDTTQERIIQSAITGAAFATAANLLSGIF